MPTATTSHEPDARPKRLHHHAFVTTDQEATRRFYEDVVGLPLVATWTEVESLMGMPEQEFCHTFYELGDGGCLAFFQFADDDFAGQVAPPIAPSPFRHVALQVTMTVQDGIRQRAQDAGFGTVDIDHGFCRSLYMTDPNGLFLEFTVDHPDMDTINVIRRARAGQDLERWLSGNHASNNEWRLDPSD